MSEGITPGIGATLAAAREDKGLTHAQVADKLKLTVRQIEALEAEDYSRLPGAVFIRGFIRNYARLLELEVDGLLSNLNVEQAPTETITVPSEGVAFTSSPVKRWLLFPLLAFVLFVLIVGALYSWLRQGEEAMVPAPQNAEALAPLTPPVSVQPVEPVAATTPAEPPATDAPVTASPATETGAPSVSQQSLPATAQPAAAVAATPLSVAPPAPGRPLAPVDMPLVKPLQPPLSAAQPAPLAAKPAQAPVQAVAKPAVRAASALKFHALEDAWVQVVDNTGQRYSKLVHAGSMETVSGIPPFKLVVGNAAQVRLDYNGHSVNLTPFIGEKVARLTLE